MKGGSGVDNQMKEICGFIYRVKRRMGWNKWLQLLFQCLILAALVSAVISLIALFVPWYEVTRCRAVDQFPMTTHVETVCLLSNRKSKPDSYVDLSINMEDYHRIKNEEK